MRLGHIAIFTHDLDRLRLFYETYFGGVSNHKYHNPKTGLQTYFLRFDGETTLELMTKPELFEKETGDAVGYHHLAFVLPDKAAVDALTERIAQAGYPVLSGPRTTGDGYYESAVADPDGNRIELVVG